MENLAVGPERGTFAWCFQKAFRAGFDSTTYAAYLKKRYHVTPESLSLDAISEEVKAWTQAGLSFELLAQRQQQIKKTMG